MTLFKYVSHENDLFQKVLDKYYQGREAEVTKHRIFSETTPSTENDINIELAQQKEELLLLYLEEYECLDEWDFADIVILKNAFNEFSDLADF